MDGNEGPAAVPARVPRRTDALRTTARSPRLRRLLAAYVLFCVTEYAAWIAVLVWAYGVGGVRGASVISVVQLVPTALLAPVVAAWCSRLSRPHALTLAYAVLAATLVVQAVALLVAPPVLVGLACAVACVANSAVRPVHYAILPDLAETTGELTASNSLSGGSEAGAMFLGPLLAGLIMVSVGPAGVVLVGAVLIGAATVLVAPLRTVGGKSGPVSAHVIIRTPPWKDLLRDPAARLFGATTFAEYLLLGALDILLVVLALDILGLPQSGVGLLNSAAGVGALVGTAATVLLVGARRLTPAILVGALTAGLPIALAGATHVTGVALLLVAVAGGGKLFYDVAARTLLQRSVSERLLVGVFGMQESTMSIGLATGAVLTPLLITWVGTTGAFVVVGLLLPGAAVVVLPGLRRADARSDVSPDDVARLMAVPFLAVLTPLLVERLVREQTERSVPAGTWVVTEGDLGDAFYVVAAGRVEVTQRGTLLRELGPGDWFGELALLRGVARTASVRSTTACTFVVLSREAFLGAVTGFARSVEAADAHAERYVDLPEVEDDRGA
jgi:MFS family permease